MGELLFSTKENEMDVRHLAKGVYYLRCLPVGLTGENEIRKLIIELRHNTRYPHELENKSFYIKIDSRHNKRFEQSTSKVQRTFFIYSTRCRRVEHHEQRGAQILCTLMNL